MPNSNCSPSTLRAEGRRGRLGSLLRGGRGRGSSNCPRQESGYSGSFSLGGGLVRRGPALNGLAVRRGRCLVRAGHSSRKTRRRLGK